MFELAANFALGGLGFLFVITLVVFVHELGHFLAGRYFGVRVETFSIGFGKELFGFTDRLGTRWKFGALPLGGYVKFWGDEGVASTPDHDKLDHISDTDRSRSFHHKNWWQKSIISAAGPLANFVLAIVILTGLFLIYGDQVEAPRIGNVKDGMPAQAAGLQPGDLVLDIDGTPIKEFQDIVRIVTVSDARNLNFHVRRENQDMHIVVTPAMIDKSDGFGDSIKDPGIGITSVIPGEIKSVVAGSPAARAGLISGDIIAGISGERLTKLSDFALAIEKTISGAQKIDLNVSRAKPLAGKPWNRELVAIPFSAQPSKVAITDVDAYVLDAAGFEVFVKGSPESYITVTFGLFDAVLKGVRVTEFIVVKTFYFIGQLLTGSGDYQQLSGPIGIATVSGKVAVQFGIVPLINLAAVLSVSIGLLNLFPIPMLDGGHILYYGIEAVRGRPLGERAQELGFRIGLAFVVSLLLFATWNDLTKLGFFGLLSFHS